LNLDKATKNSLFCLASVLMGDIKWWTFAQRALRRFT